MEFIVNLFYSNKQLDFMKNFIKSEEDENKISFKYNMLEELELRGLEISNQIFPTKIKKIKFIQCTFSSIASSPSSKDPLNPYNIIADFSKYQFLKEIDIKWNSHIPSKSYETQFQIFKLKLPHSLNKLYIHNIYNISGNTRCILDLSENEYIKVLHIQSVYYIEIVFPQQLDEFIFKECHLKHIDSSSDYKQILDMSNIDFIKYIEIEDKTPFKLPKKVESLKINYYEKINLEYDNIEMLKNISIGGVSDINFIFQFEFNNYIENISFYNFSCMEGTDAYTVKPNTYFKPNAKLKEFSKYKNLKSFCVNGVELIDYIQS